MKQIKWNSVSEVPPKNGEYMYQYDGTRSDLAFEAEFDSGTWFIRDRNKPVFDGAIITPQVGDLWRQVIDCKEAN
jgi:hypothetical protein